MTSTSINRIQSIRYLSVLSSTLILGAAASLSNAQQCNPVELTKLIENGAVSDSNFGFRVSMDGNLAIVGAPNSETNFNTFGAAHIYERDNTGNWVLNATLQPSDGRPHIQFGAYVSISGNTAVIGAPFTDNGDPNTNADFGSAYVFVRNTNGDWIEQAKLIASDTATHDLFGGTVAICDDTIIVGSWQNNNLAGSAYIFERTNDQWTQSALLVQPALETTGDLFGIALALDGDIAVIGARENGVLNGNPAGNGSAYVFARLPNNTWVQRARITANNGAPGDGFGASVSISGDTIAIGAPFDDGPGEESGTAYIFNTIDGGLTWTQHTRFFPIDGTNGDFFGFPIVTNGNTTIVGSTFNDDFGNNSGSAYIYALEGGKWAPQTNILASDGEEGDQFGVSIAMSADYAIIGAYLNDDNGLDSGSAYIFKLNCNLCPADLTGDGSLNFFDVSAFLTAFTNQDPVADFAADGLFNFFDVSAFLAAFATGCP